MTSKIIVPFLGPVTPAAIDEWLHQCEDGFAIYASTKSDKSPQLDVITQIRLTGTHLQEPTTAAWWSAGRKEFLALPSWEQFEKRIRGRFMAKGYRLLALRTFFLCAQGRLPFPEYAANLMEARNLAGSSAITPSIHKYQLLFHSQTTLVLRIMALPEFDIDTISIDDLTSLMSMQWDSITSEGRASIRPTFTTPSSIISTRTPSSTITPPTSSLPLLTDAERTRLSTAGGCWRCRKTPADSDWVHHVGRNCPGDAARGILPGRDFVKVKRETTGAALYFDMDGEDQPDYPDDDEYPDPVDVETDSD
jgi:hypothetical protein